MADLADSAYRSSCLYLLLPLVCFNPSYIGSVWILFLNEKWFEQEEKERSKESIFEVSIMILENRTEMIEVLS